MNSIEALSSEGFASAGLFCGVFVLHADTNKIIIPIQNAFFIIFLPAKVQLFIDSTKTITKKLRKEKRGAL